MRYLIMIHSNSASQAAFQRLGMSREAFGRAHQALNAELAEAGDLIAAEGLADVSLAKRVSASGGRTVVSDGPFAEAKEQLAGFYLVECPDLEHALALAARVPDALFTDVEVRPVLELRGQEM